MSPPRVTLSPRREHECCAKRCICKISDRASNAFKRPSASEIGDGRAQMHRVLGAAQSAHRLFHRRRRRGGDGDRISDGAAHEAFRPVIGDPFDEIRPAFDQPLEVRCVGNRGRSRLTPARTFEPSDGWRLLRRQGRFDRAHAAPSTAGSTKAAPSP